MGGFVFEKQSFFYFFMGHPIRLFLLGSGVVFFFLIVDGSLWRYWSLYRSQKSVASRIVELREQSEQLDFKIHQAQKPTYMEHEATKQFDYVKEGDLIFIFSQ